MKILYSQIKELVSDLKATPRNVGEALTNIGFMMDGFEEVTYRGKKDYLLGLEIRQNRADCLSVVGLSREVAAYYGLKIKLPEVTPVSFLSDEPSVKVESEKLVKRVLALNMEGLKNEESPKWLKEILSFYDMNSINLLVDLSNYVMIYTGYPSHLIDSSKVKGRIRWATNKEKKKFTTLDDTTITLDGKNELTIEDDEKILALAGIIGGKEAAIDHKTQTIFMEMAIYDYDSIRQNARNLRIVTEASNRLEKNLDPNSAYYAFQLLTSLIIKHCNGAVCSGLYDYYPEKRLTPSIKFNPDKVSIFAGIEIPTNQSRKILSDLDFSVDDKNKKLWVIQPPISRTDVEMEEDVIEEVIRIFGYDKIPFDKVPKIEVVKDITSRNVLLSKKVRDVLSPLGFDEILSWPLTKAGENEGTNYKDWDILKLQNSVNEDFPDLRQSIGTGLVSQFREYQKNNVDKIRIFEIGRVFGKKGDDYYEEELLGILMNTTSNIGVSGARGVMETTLRSLGIKEIKYEKADRKPKIANPYSCWDVYVKTVKVGILYKLSLEKSNGNTYFVEVNMNKITDMLDKFKIIPTVEITKKLVILDANIETKKDESLNKYLNTIKGKIPDSKVWSMEVVDKFELDKKTRYTVRVTYRELSDQEAKNIHLLAFSTKVK